VTDAMIALTCYFLSVGCAVTSFAYLMAGLVDWHNRQ